MPLRPSSFDDTRRGGDRDVYTVGRLNREVRQLLEHGMPVIWIEAGLSWIPFVMQRIDHEYMLRPSDCPLLKKKPSDYMRDMYYSIQPMEIQDMQALEVTFRMMNAETQLMYSSDYPHWDFDLPSTISDLPFLTEKAKHNILGGTAARLFKLKPRSEAQKQNLIKFGNYTAA